MKIDFVLSTTTQYACNVTLDKLLKESQDKPFEDFIVIAPETKTLAVERYLLDHSKNNAFCNIYVYSFNRLLKRLQKKRIFPLSKEAGIMIVRNIIMNSFDKFVCYKKTAGTIGFAEGIYETIQQLKSSGISSIELSESAKKCATALRIKLEDIAFIYDAYETYLGEELLDPSDKLTMLENQLELSDKVKNSHIFLVGFDALTANACGVIKSMAKNARSLTASASFIHKEKPNSHIADNEVFEHLKQVADELHYQYEPIFVECPLEGDFKHISENLYAYPTLTKPTQGNLFLFGAPSFDIESRKVASLIKEDILKEKCRYKDNYIYLANENIKDSLTNALDEYEIPYFIASPYEFENHQLFVFIKLLFSMVRKNMEKEDVLEFARCELLNFENLVVDDFENFVIKFGINHNKFTKPFVCKEQNDAFINAENVRQYIYNIVWEFSEIYNENMNVEELSDVLIKFLDKFGIENKLNLLKEKQLKLGEDRNALATQQAYSKAKEVLLMLAQFLSSQTLKLDDFYTLLISGLESTDISLIPLGIDQVQIVCSPDGLYGVKNLYVMGAVDGCFPIREQDLGLIQDGEIMSLEDISERKIEPTIKTINRRERYKVFELLQTPKNKLVISFSEHSETGEETKMSSVIQNLASLFVDNEGLQLSIYKYFSQYKENPENIDSLSDLAYTLGSKTVALNYLAENLASFKQGMSYKAGSYAICSLYKALIDNVEEDIKEKFNNINIEKEFEYVQNANKLFFPKGKTSISQLERYFACPFEHFANYGLKLKERENVGMRSLDVGDILHELAEKFVKFYQVRKNVNIEMFAKNTLNKILSQEKYSEEDNRILIKLLESEAKRICVALAEEIDSTAFNSTLTEQWFGGDEFKGIMLKSNTPVLLVGKIDRIDQTKDYYRIIDYKTGKIESSAEDIYYGKKLQLALYLSAMSNLKKIPAGVLYFPLRNEFTKGKVKAKEAYKMKGFVLQDVNVLTQMDRTLSLDNPKSRFIPADLKTSKEHVNSGLIEIKSNNAHLLLSEIKSVANYALAVSSQAVDEMNLGYVKPSPFKKSNRKTCDYCEFKNICGIISNGYKTVREPSLENAKNFYKGKDEWENK